MKAQLHYKPQQTELIILPDATEPNDNPFIEGVTVRAMPIIVPASTMPRGEWPIPLAERHKGWIPDVSPDAGTPAARERRALESRLAMGLKE